MKLNNGEADIKDTTFELPRILTLLFLTLLNSVARVDLIIYVHTHLSATYSW